MADRDERIAKIKQKAQQLASTHPTHDWSHTIRVLNLAHRIASHYEHVNLNVLDLAVYLHDIARNEEDKSGGKIDHAQAGAAMAREILEQEGFSEDTIDTIQSIIISHRFRKGKNSEPNSLEAKILFDADKLDSIGATGIARAFLYAGENRYALYRPLPRGYDGRTRKKNPDVHTANIEFEVKLRWIKDLLFTQEGQEIAKERHNFMQEFFSRLKEEVEGNC